MASFNLDFICRYNMTTHVKAHEGIHRPQRKNIACPICNESFNRQEKLKVHLTQRHGTVGTAAAISSKQPQATESGNSTIIVVEKSAPIEIKSLDESTDEYILSDSMFCNILDGKEKLIF